MEYLLILLVSLGAAFGIAYGIISWQEALRCNRKEGGYPCHGQNCEGCYRKVGGNVVYEYEQPLNDWGKAPLQSWDV